jgi:hypothetical protein
MENPIDCPIGKYCPQQTNAVNNEAIACPPGTYNDHVNIGSADECTPCPPGQYCNCVGGCTAKPTSSPCDAGFFCPYGSSAPNGYTDAYVFGLGASGLCPKGYYCEAGTIAATPCPTTTYND